MGDYPLLCGALACRSCFSSFIILLVVCCLDFFLAAGYIILQDLIIQSVQWSLDSRFYKYLRAVFCFCLLSYSPFIMAGRFPSHELFHLLLVHLLLLILLSSSSLPFLSFLLHHQPADAVVNVLPLAVQQYIPVVAYPQGFSPLAGKAVPEQGSDLECHVRR